MSISWETVLVAITTGVGTGVLTHVVGPFTAYCINKRATREAWRREAINQVRDYIPRCIEQPEVFNSLVNIDAFTRLPPYLTTEVVQRVEEGSYISPEGNLARPIWAETLLDDLYRLEQKWAF